jgi:hypothetical protein
MTGFRLMSERFGARRPTPFPRGQLTHRASRALPLELMSVATQGSRARGGRGE